MALTDTAAKNAKADPAKPAGAKLTDGQGLYLLVKSAGKYWRFDYRFADKRKTLALGIYPAVTLADAAKPISPLGETSSVTVTLPFLPVR